MIDLNKLLGLNGKNVMVTGAASGIGFGVARFLSETGARVALIDVNETQGKEKEKAINDNGGGSFVTG